MSIIDLQNLINTWQYKKTDVVLKPTDVSATLYDENNVMATYVHGYQIPTGSIKYEFNKCLTDVQNGQTVFIQMAYFMNFDNYTQWLAVANNVFINGGI